MGEAGAASPENLIPRLRGRNFLALGSRGEDLFVLRRDGLRAPHYFRYMGAVPLMENTQVGISSA